MADNGEAEETVVPREEDISSGVKESGWTNPLGWTDDGTDDEFVVNMDFQPLDAAYDHYQTPEYVLDEDIIESLDSERDAKINVAKHRKRFEEEDKQM